MNARPLEPAHGPRGRALLVALLLFGLAAASTVGLTGESAPSGEDPVDSARVLAMVNGQPVMAEEVEQHLESLHGAVSAQDGVRFDADRMMFRVINDVLLVQEARAMGLDEDPAIRDEVDAYRDQLMLAALQKTEFEDKVQVTDDEVDRMFVEMYRQAQLRVVTSYDREGAEAMLADLKAGADMDAMARERSVDPIRIRGGLLKMAPRIRLQPEVANVAFQAKPGELLGPIRTDLGWTVARVESFRDPEVEDEAKAKKNARLLLMKDELGRLRAEFARGVRERFPVRIDEDVIASMKPSRLPDGRLTPAIVDPAAIVVRIGDSRVIRADQFGVALVERWDTVRNEEAALASLPIVLDGAIERELMLAEAERQGYGERPEIRRKVLALEDSLLVPKILEEVVAGNIKTTKEEMNRYYEEHLDEFRQPPTLTVGQITVADRDEADRIADQLEQGADLAWLAKQNSIDRFKNDGGFRGQLSPAPGTGPFNEELLASSAGDVIGPYGEDGNWTVTKVLHREAGAVYPLEKVSGNVRQAVFASKLPAAIERFVTTLRERSEIEIYEDRVAQLRILKAVEEKDEGGGTSGGHAH